MNEKVELLEKSFSKSEHEKIVAKLEAEYEHKIEKLKNEHDTKLSYINNRHIAKHNERNAGRMAAVAQLRDDKPLELAVTAEIKEDSNVLFNNLSVACGLAYVSV